MSSNRKNILTTSSYEVWQSQFFRARIALACKLSMLFFGISGLFSGLMIYLDRSKDIWDLRLNILSLLLSGVSLLGINSSRGKTQPKLVFIGLSLLLMFASNLETSAEGIVLSNEFSSAAFLILAVLIPVKLPLHLISQIGIILVYFLSSRYLNQPEGNTFISEAAVLFMELFDIFRLCFAYDLTIFLQEKLRQSEFKTRQELQSFVQNISQELRQPLLANLSKIEQILKHSGDSILIARSSSIKMLLKSDRQLDLIQLMLEKARINKLQQANQTQTDYQLWRSRFIKQRLSWFLGIYFSYYFIFLIVGVYVVVFEAQSAEQRAPFLSYCSTSAWLILSLTVCYQLSRSRWGKSHFATLFVGTILLVCLTAQISELFAGYFKLGVKSDIFLFAAILFPVFWRMHLMAQISVAIGYGAIAGVLTALSIDIPMTSSEIFEEILFFAIVCLVCNITVYSLERMRKAEYESRRQMQLFLYAIAHDLKTPVLGMSMFLENLLSQPQKTFEFTRVKVQKMLQASDRQLYLLDSLMEVYQSESKGIICNCQPTALNSVVLSLSDGLKPILLKNEASLTNLIPHSLPKINADPIQLSRVYENLIINAIKHNPPGVNILLKAKLQKNLLYCTVEDDGMGMNPETCDLIFFLYGGESVRRTPGLGLGLYLCRQIIQAHQGEIGVESSPGAGAIFWFTLPVARRGFSRNAPA